MAARHQTLRATIAWSYELLDPAQQRLFRQLSIFTGGWTLAAAEALLAPDDGPHAAGDVLEGLTALVDQNLARQTSQANSEPRFGMLETIREFGLEQLSASGEEHAVRQRHAAYFLALAEQAGPRVEDGNRTWLARLDPEPDNLRAAFAWLSEQWDAEPCLRLVGDLRSFWVQRGYVSEGWAQIQSALALPDAARPTAARAHALTAAGQLAFLRGDDAGSVPFNTEALEIAQALGDRTAQPWLFTALGLAARNLDDLDLAAHYWQRGLALARELGDAVSIARLVGNLSELAEPFGDSRDTDRRQDIADEILALGRAADDLNTIAIGLRELATVAIERGDYQQAAGLLAESLAIAEDGGLQWGLPYDLSNVARLALATEQHVCAAQVLGAHDVLRERMGLPVWPAERAAHEQLLATVRAAMPGDAHAAAWTAGHVMPLEEAIAVAKTVLAVAVFPASRPAATSPASPYGLTERELQVLRLLTEGLSDREIAERLFISPHTVMRHVAGVLGKLGVNSRTAAATLAVREGIA